VHFLDPIGFQLGLGISLGVHSLTIVTGLSFFGIVWSIGTDGESIKQVDHEKSTIPFTGNYNEKTEKYSDRKNNSQANSFIFVFVMVFSTG
jgi:hypothetical protein